ncbi:hypothetical protein, partial [Brucella anthropi]|uniref:hypothetical protein n=1 Tax=Brucella anthropi TaxID=529 RepID=UPI00384B6FEF
FDAFMPSTPSPSQENSAENSHYKRSSFKGAEHFDYANWRVGSNRRKRQAFKFRSVGAGFGNSQRRNTIL